MVCQWCLLKSWRIHKMGAQRGRNIGIYFWCVFINRNFRRVVRVSFISYLRRQNKSFLFILSMPRYCWYLIHSRRLIIGLSLNVEVIRLSIDWIFQQTIRMVILRVFLGIWLAVPRLKGVVSYTVWSLESKICLMALNAVNWGIDEIGWLLISGSYWRKLSRKFRVLKRRQLGHLISRRWVGVRKAGFQRAWRSLNLMLTTIKIDNFSIASSSIWSNKCLILNSFPDIFW